MQTDRHELARTWLKTASDDLRATRALAREIPAAACFHAQQTGEKALKAATIALAGDTVRTHRLLDLISELRALGADVSPDVFRAAQVLERYYAPTRYPDALNGLDPANVFTEVDALETYAHAEVVLRFAARIVDDSQTNSFEP